MKQRSRDADPTGYQYRLRRANPARYLWRGAKSRARRSGVAFDILPEDITIPTHCPVFGIPLTICDGRQTDGSPSLDRIRSTEGYVKNNIEVISWKANRLKGNATAEELRRLADYYGQEVRKPVAATDPKNTSKRVRRKVV